MPDGSRRSREHWADSMEAGPPDPPAHVHRLPKVVRLALGGLLAAVFLLLVAVGFLTVYVYQANQYVQGRGEFRDAEQARMEAESLERIRRAMCDLLDTFPAGVPSLERPRAKYECGPGLPFDALTPDEQARLRPSGASAPTVADRPDPLDEADRTRERQPIQSGASEPAPTPDRFRPEPSPEPGPLGSVTTPVCELVAICLPDLTEE